MNFPAFSQTPVLMLLIASVIVAEPARITVQVNQPGMAVTPTMHGLFFEDINYGADGGLYAEMIQNRSFEDREPFYAWSEVVAEDARGLLKPESEEPLNVNNPQFSDPDSPEN